MTQFLLKFFGTIIGLILAMKAIGILFSWINYGLNKLKPKRKKVKVENNN